MKVGIVCAFDILYGRVLLLKEYYEQKGYEVTVITSNFSHRQKAVYQPNADVVLSVPKYQRNLSFARIYSHLVFSQKVHDVVLKRSFDLVHCIIPCNSLVKALALAKQKANFQLLVDVNDVWPETMPISFGKNMLPFQIWKGYRDHYIDQADAVICECQLFTQYVPMAKTVYWANPHPQVGSTPHLSKTQLDLCYLGSVNNIIDIDYIVSLLEQCQKRIPTSLHCMAKGERLEELIKRCQMVNVKVIDHHEVYDPHQKQAIFDACHYGINIMKESVVVGISLKSLDYMWGGLPLINSLQADTKQFCLEHQVGIQIDRQNIQQTVQQIIAHRLDESMRQKVRSFYQQTFTKQRFYEAMDQIMDDLKKKKMHCMQ